MAGPPSPETQEAAAWVERHLLLSGLFDPRRSGPRPRELQQLEDVEVALLVHYLRRREELITMRRHALGPLYEPMIDQTRAMGREAFDRFLGLERGRASQLLAQAQELQAERAIEEANRAIFAIMRNEGLEAPSDIADDEDGPDRREAYRSRYAELARRYARRYGVPFGRKAVWIYRSSDASWNERQWRKVDLPGELQRTYE